jgi:hypothetical protein
MTSKEKAQYLFDIYTNYVGEYDVNKHAKQCAIIAVDEIIAQIEPSVSMDVISARIKYWQEVKQEIENL